MRLAERNKCEDGKAKMKVRAGPGHESRVSFVVFIHVQGTHVRVVVGGGGFISASRLCRKRESGLGTSLPWPGQCNMMSRC
jgi:hypothetical protein